MRGVYSVARPLFLVPYFSPYFSRPLFPPYFPYHSAPVSLTGTVRP